MHADESLRLALRHVPGEGPARLRRVGVGLASETYRVDRDGASYSLRISQPKGRAGFDERWELAVRAVAGSAGYAPPVSRAAPEEGVLVSSWIEGRCFEAATAAQPARIAAVADLLRGIHALTPPRPERCAAPSDWIAGYERAIGGGAMRIAFDAAGLRRAAAARLELLDRQGASARVLCHSDLHPLNLVETEAGLVALDWEYAHVADPLWDTAGWSCVNDFPEAARGTLLVRYLGRAPGSEERARFDALAWLYDYVCVLWSEVYARTSADRADPAVLARASRILARLG